MCQRNSGTIDTSPGYDKLFEEPVDERVDEVGDEHVDEPVELQEEGMLEQDLHVADNRVETRSCQSGTSE